MPIYINLNVEIKCDECGEDVAYDTFTESDYRDVEDDIDEVKENMDGVCIDDEYLCNDCAKKRKIDAICGE